MKKQESEAEPVYKIAELSWSVRMEGAAGNKYKNCSLGMKQRIGIAMALLGNPKLLVLDEPINGQDVDGMCVMREVLTDIAANGATILILVMTTMMDGSVSVNPQTGAETVIQGFDSVWQIIGSVSTAQPNMPMDMTAMCNINLLYFIVSVLACLFVSEDFRSGYAKNLFTVRAKKIDYVISKTLVCDLGGALMVGMFLFMMIPMLTPLDATILNVLLCLAGGLLFSAGLGAISNRVAY